MNETAQTAEAIFAEAIEIAAPAERAAYLERACEGDVSLQEAVEKLVVDHFRAGSFLESPLFDLALTAELSAITEAAGAVIGPYKLLQQIGEGGMGVVFMAEQTAPIHRMVALKIIKPGMDTRQVIARFEAERQALAMMDHPNIARVIDAGTTETGRPYFVMELVKGVPITDYCDDQHLAIRQRLELFTEVCHAVQHAHQKGVIHRDLKPSNVMMAEYDGNPVPKVIDFGVAKATALRLTERTMFTQFGQIIGTFEYMSPEQARFNQLDVDTRTDIYSLGVLLYELLTGTTPLEKQRLETAAFDETLRIIRHEEPPKPSTRLSSLPLRERVEMRETSSLATIAANRHTDPSRLSKDVRGELDWIVMKAIEKDRNRRYETASALAADVTHYLNDEPITAAAPSRLYRAGKLVRRNKWPVTTATALALAMVIAAVTLAVSNVMIREEQARTQEEKDRVEVAQKLAETRAHEIQRQMERLKAANALLDRGRWYVGQRRWDDAHVAFTKAIQMRPDHVSSWVERGDLHTRLGLWDLAAADYAHEMELREPDIALRWLQHVTLCLHVGDTDRYRVTCRKMRQRFRGTLSSVFAEELVRSSLLAPDPGVNTLQLVELAEKIAAIQPWTGLYVLGMAHFRAGQYEQAIQRLEELAAKSQLPITFIRHPVLAMAYHQLGRSDEARQSLQEAADVLDEWTQKHYEVQEEHWVAHQGAEGVWLVPWWDYLECQLTYREAKMLIDGSAPLDDARLHVLRARAFAGLRWVEKASEVYDAALKLSAHDPQIRLEVHRNEGYCFINRGHWRKAAEEFAKACELRPNDSYLWRFRAVALFASGDLAAYRQSCAAMFERFNDAQGGVPTANLLLACVLGQDALPDMTKLLPLSRRADSLWHWGIWARGAALYRAGHYKESARCFETATQTYRPRALDWCFLAMGNQRLGRREEARRCLDEAARWIDEANRQEMDDLSGTRPTWGDWHERVVYPMLLREAEQLLNVESRASVRSNQQSGL